MGKPVVSTTVGAEARADIGTRVRGSRRPTWGSPMRSSRCCGIRGAGVRWDRRAGGWSWNATRGPRSHANSVHVRQLLARTVLEFACDLGPRVAFHDQPPARLSQRTPAPRIPQQRDDRIGNPRGSSAARTRVPMSARGPLHPPLWKRPASPSRAPRRSSGVSRRPPEAGTTYTAARRCTGGHRPRYR